MQQAPHYGDVVTEVIEFLKRQLERCRQVGIDHSRLCIDPRNRFGKTAEHNILLLQSIHRMHKELDCPVLIGHSRKRFLAKILGRRSKKDWPAHGRIRRSRSTRSDSSAFMTLLPCETP